MSYQVFARKFRPQTFEEVIGQDPVVITLRNSIRQERIAQSFLFAGPRGIGKTSTARVLAKALNCEKGPGTDPCGKCLQCKEIAQANSLDVLEIDGASNRGIDEIRNLRETVKFKPTQGRYKVYIIDEVHMLTTEAFNALLKTLEEPPGHVKFIFATTEPHKVPLTILSRCQRFNFKRITVSEISKKIETIAKKENIKYEKNVPFLIARASEGALRDAESLLDQLVTFSKDKIREEDVLFMLGLAADEVYFSVLTALRSGNAQAVFERVEEIYQNGADLVQFSKGLFEIFRHLLIFQSADKPEQFVEVSENAGAELKKRKNDFSKGELLLALNILQNLLGQLRRNLAPPKLLVETTLLKLLHLDGLKSVEEISKGAGVPAPVQRSKPASIPGAGVSKISAPAGPSVPEKRETSAASGQGHVLSMTLDAAEGFWPRVIEYVKTKRMSTGIFLSESEPVEINDQTVVLGLPSEFQFHKETLEKDINRKLVEEAFEVVSGTKIRAQFVITRPAQETGGAEQETVPAAEETKLPDIIMQAMNIFDGAKIIRKD